MRTFHHFGIPTDQPREGETYLEDAKLFITDVEASANKIEWLRFEPGSPMPEMLKSVPHIAYVVDDITAELAGADVLMEPFTPMKGVTVAFVIEEGAPIEVMEMSQA